MKKAFQLFVCERIQKGILNDKEKSDSEDSR